MGPLHDRIAAAWLRTAISKKYVDDLLGKVETGDLSFDHLFEGRRRMVVDPGDHGGLGATEPPSAKSLQTFMADSLKGDARPDWKSGYLIEDGKRKSKIGKAIQKAIRKQVGKDGELYSSMQKVRRGLVKGESPIQLTLGVGRDNVRALIGMGHLLVDDFPTEELWRENKRYGAPSPDSWKEIRKVADKFAKLTPGERREAMDKHKAQYEDKEARQKKLPNGMPDLETVVTEPERHQYWDARGLFQTHVQMEARAQQRRDEGKDDGKEGAEWLMSHFTKWAERTSDFYESDDAEPVRKLHELGSALKFQFGTPRLQELQGLRKVEEDKQAYDLWRGFHADELAMVVSRDPVDVLRMSDHPKAAQAIQSCHSEGGSEFQCAIDEAHDGGLIAYVVKKSDVEGRDIDEGELFEDQSRGVKGIKPYARLRIRRFEKGEGEDGVEVAVPETTTYGAEFPALVDAVTGWAREVQPEFKRGDSGFSGRADDWTLTGGAYEDTPSTELFDNFFGRDDDDDEPEEDEYDPYGEGYTAEDSPYRQFTDGGRDMGGDAEFGSRMVHPWRESDKSDFWDWMNEHHPKIPNPNTGGRVKEIVPSTLKGYARGRSGYVSNRARQVVQRYMGQYQKARQEYAEARARGEKRASRVATCWMRTAKYSPVFLQWATSRKHRNPDTNNLVEFISLPGRQRKLLYRQWSRGRDPAEEERRGPRGIVPVDRLAVRAKAEKIAQGLTKIKFEEDDVPLGRNRTQPWPHRAGHVEVTDVRGQKRPIPLRVSTAQAPEGNWRAGRKYVARGELTTRHQGKGDPGTPSGVKIYLDEKVTPAQLREDGDRLENEIYGVLLHELTHAQDVMEPPAVTEKRRRKEPDRAKEYHNRPSEVRAFKQQIADEIQRGMHFAYRDEEDPDWIGADADSVMELLSGSPTWDRIQEHLDPGNRRSVLKTVADVVRRFKRERGGKVASGSFEDWTKGRRFPNPNPRGRKRDILFKSLPKVEQDRIRARWEGDRGDGGTTPGKVADPLFHTTSHASLEDIAENGLSPRSGGGTFNHGVYGEHSQGKVFLSDNPEAARAWQSKVFDQLEDRHGDETEKLGRRVPVMLRVKNRETERDPVGDEDVSGSRYTEDAVPPEDVEFWHPKDKRWAPVSSWGSDTAAEHAVLRDNHGAYVDDEMFMPGEDDEDAYDRDDAATIERERQEQEEARRREEERRRPEEERRRREERERQQAEYLEPATRRKWIDKIKQDGAKFPIPGMDTKPGVFPKMWQDRLKVDEHGEPHPDHPLASGKVASRWLLRVAAYSEEFLQWARSTEHRNPVSGNRVKFDSLPTADQVKIHERWKGSRGPQGPGLQDTGKETWQGGTVYRADVKRDSFVHFTPQSRARQIMESGKLLADPPHKKFGIEGVQAISLGYGASVPGTQTTHIEENADDPLVAVVFQTKSVPSQGYVEEVLWDGDVGLHGAKVVGADEARGMLERVPSRISEDDMVTYGGSSKTAKYSDEFLKAVGGRRFRNPDTGNDVQFDSLPDPEQKRIHDQWATRGRSTGDALEPYLRENRYDHVKFQVQAQGKKARQAHRLLGSNGDERELKRRALDLAGMGSLGSLVESADVTVADKDYGGTEVRVLGRGKNKLHFDRILHFDEDGFPDFVRNENFSVAPDAPEGVATRMLVSQVPAAEAAGFKEINTYAGGTGPERLGQYEDEYAEGDEPPEDEAMQGYYVWPRLGFDADLGVEDEFDRHSLMGSMPAGLEDKVGKLAEDEGAPLSMRHIMMVPEARDWWRAQGQPMELRFPLDEGHEDYDPTPRRVLSRYAAEKARLAGKGPQEWAARVARLGEQDEYILDGIWNQLRRELENKKRVTKKARRVASMWLERILLARYSPEFHRSVFNQKFRHPETGNQVIFYSLPDEEQQKVHSRWAERKQLPQTKMRRKDFNRMREESRDRERGFDPGGEQAAAKADRKEMVQAIMKLKKRKVPARIVDKERKSLIREMESRRLRRKTEREKAFLESQGGASVAPS